MDGFFHQIAPFQQHSRLLYALWILDSCFGATCYASLRVAIESSCSGPDLTHVEPLLDSSSSKTLCTYCLSLAHQVVCWSRPAYHHLLRHQMLQLCSCPMFVLS